MVGLAGEGGGGGGGGVVRLEPGGRTASRGVGVAGGAGAPVLRLLSVQGPSRGHPGGDQQGGDEPRGDPGGADPGHQQAQGEHSYPGPTAHPADDHGSLQHAGHELDGVGQSVAHQAVQGGEDLGQEGLLHTGHRPEPLPRQELEADGCQTVEAAADGGEGPAEHAGHEEARQAGDVAGNVEDMERQHLVSLPHLQTGAFQLRD